MNYRVKKEDDLYDAFYNAMDDLSVGNIKNAKVALKEILKKDMDFIDAYNGLVFAYEDEGSKQKARECADIAFEKTKEENKQWPKEMIWGNIDNRKYLRAICNKAIYLHEDGKTKEAEKLYQLLLKMNPSDNQGVRYLLAALFAEKEPKIVETLTNKGNDAQDWSELENLLETQNKKFKFWNG